MAGATRRAFEDGAGDDSDGAIFVAGARTRASSIVDATYDGCAFTHGAPGGRSVRA